MYLRRSIINKIRNRSLLQAGMLAFGDMFSTNGKNLISFIKFDEETHTNYIIVDVTSLDMLRNIVYRF